MTTKVFSIPPIYIEPFDIEGLVFSIDMLDEELTFPYIKSIKFNNQKTPLSYNDEVEDWFETINSETVNAITDHLLWYAKKNWDSGYNPK